MAMQPDGQTALHLAAEEATLDCTMLEVKQNLVKVSTNDQFQACFGKFI